MEKPRIAAKQPAVLSLDPGTYYWCQCGRSRDQPFCDGSHQGTGIEPVEFSLNEKKEIALVPVQADQDTPPFSRRHATRRFDFVGRLAHLPICSAAVQLTDLPYPAA